MFSGEEIDMKALHPSFSVAAQYSCNHTFRVNICSGSQFISMKKRNFFFKGARTNT